MADNQTAVEDPHQQQRSTSTPKSMSTVPGSLSSKSHSMKHGHTSKAATMISPESKHHHHHHHSHHHSHHNNPHVIHKTTSESLRLGADVNASGSSVGATTPSTNSSSSGTGSNCNSVQLHFNAPGPISRKPKTSSFQITSVTVGNKLSADNGEDSADDLDESHTDDNSRITDLENETPSVSEDTFSKEDVFFSSNALGTAPVIPTSSQYGLVIVDPDLGGVGGASGQSLSNVHVSVTDAGINIVGPAGGKLNDGDQKELQHRNERFKVVKIESTEPFKRGRWMCMDYLDHTTLQQTQTNTESTSTPSTGTAATVTTNDSGVVTENHVDSGENIDSALKVNFNPSTASPGQTLQNPIPVSVSEQQPHPAATAPAPIQVQTLSHVPNVPSNSVQQQNASAQSLPPVQLQHAISGQVSHQSIPAQAAPEFQPSVTSNANIQGQSQPAHFYVANQPQPVIAPTHVHGATLPSNINMQNGAPTNVPSQPQQHTQPQTMSSINVSMSVPSSTITSEQASVNAASSLPQSMVQPSIANQQANVIQPPQQALTTHSAPQTQVPSDLFIAQSVPQSYTTPPVSSSTMSVASNTNITSQDIQSSSETTMPPTQSNVISPAGANTGVLPIAEGANVQGAQQQSVTPGITNVIQDTITPSAASTISDPTVISAAIQAQQQVTPAAPSAPATLQTQQSVVNNEETQQPPVETDSESVSGLTLALSSSRKRASSKLGTTSTSGPAQSSLDSKLPLKLGSSMQKGSDNRRPHSRGSCTHIALGDCIQKLIGVKEDAGEEAASSSSAADKKIQPVEEPQGIPIPRSPRVDATTAIAHSASPSHGSPFYCSSPSTVPAAPQVATSYDTRFAGNPGLRVIGKTMSIPTSFSYRPPGAGSSSSSQRSICSAGAGADNRSGMLCAVFEFSSYFNISRTSSYNYY